MKYRVTFYKSAIGPDSDIMTGRFYITASNIDNVYGYINLMNTRLLGYTPYFEVIKIN